MKVESDEVKEGDGEGDDEGKGESDEVRVEGDGEGDGESDETRVEGEGDKVRVEGESVSPATWSSIHLPMPELPEYLEANSFNSPLVRVRVSVRVRVR